MTHEEIAKEFNQKFPLPKILALSGGKGVERDLMNSWLRQTLTTYRAQVLEEARIELEAEKMSRAIDNAHN